MRKNNNLQIDNQKKCFKIFRVNLNNDYPFSIGENISTSKNVSFALATLLRQERCLYIQIPQNWLSTVSSLINYPINYFSFSDSESNQLKKKNQSILVLSELKWHIEDIENDKELSVNDNISGTLYKEKNVIQVD